MTLLRIAFRNLFRQKRRNFLLGSAIALGTAVLILANSFSHGISDTLINRVVVIIAGHVNVGFAYEGKMMSQVLRGGAHWKEKIEKIPGVKKVEPSMGVFGRAVGNGKSDNMILVGLYAGEQMTAEDSALIADNFPMAEGTWMCLLDSTIENPLIISIEKAKFLNVKMGDVVRVRLQDVHGRFIAARLTVSGIFNPTNIFMESALMINIDDMTALMGLRPEDSPYLYLTLDNPEQDAVRIADSIWTMLAPPLAFIQGTLQHQQKDLGKVLYSGYKADSTLRTPIRQLVQDTTFTWKKREIVVSAAFAQANGIAVGDTLSLQYPARFPTAEVSDNSVRLVVGALRQSDPALPDQLLLGHEEHFYNPYYDVLPQVPSSQEVALPTDTSLSLYKALTTEWIRMERSRTTDEVTTRKRLISQGKFKGTVATVDTMYEAASSILQFEAALQMITFGAVMVIFFIILIGVINTLRMTVRERTREIGTMRAIGMQSSEVRWVFLLETGLLGLLSAISGTLLSFLAMALLSSITIPSAGNPLGIILVHDNLVFVPTVFAVVFFNALIVLISVATAWFPASRAAKLPAATALRHYD